MAYLRKKIGPTIGRVVVKRPSSVTADNQTNFCGQSVFHSRGYVPISAANCIAISPYHQCLKFTTPIPSIFIFASSSSTPVFFLWSSSIPTNTQCLKITQNVAFEFFILAFSTNFCPFKSDLPGNTV